MREDILAIPMQDSVFLSPSQIDQLKSRVQQGHEPASAALAQLREDAEVTLGREPSPPQEWYVPGYYIDPAGHVKAKNSLADDANGAYGLALMHCLTGEERFARGAVRLLDAWGTGVERMRTEDDSTLSFSYHFPALIFAASLLEDSPLWSDFGRRQFQDFVRDKALSLNTMHHANNWGNWGLVLVLATAAYLRDEALLAKGIERWKEFIAEQIAVDGHLPHEVTRNDGVGEHGIWYSHFTLMPQTLAAAIALVQGVDLYDYIAPNGRSLRLAYERLVPWACDPATFPYFTGAEGKRQVATDYVGYWEILNGRWPNAQAAALLAEKRPLTAIHSAPYLTLTHGE